MKCKHNKRLEVNSLEAYYQYEAKVEKGLKQRQCPKCCKWFFHGEFGKGWKQGIEYKAWGKKTET